MIVFLIDWSVLVGFVAPESCQTCREKENFCIYNKLAPFF